MTTEYGRGTARYGDFGRYTFQSALSDWEVDYDGLSNYAVQRIFELGYDPEVFTDFDSMQGSGRGSGYNERIGKKYQWIVFYEILAKVSDNCKLFDESNYSSSETRNYVLYEGPWNPYVRDIDPTITIKSTQKESSIDRPNGFPWWVPVQNLNWNNDAEQWKKDVDDFPNVEELLTVTDKDGIEWLNLSTHLDWREPKKVGEDRWEMSQKRIWYDIGSWLVKPIELRQMLKINNVYKAGRNWMPGLSNRYQLFSREFYWSPASLFFELNPYYGGDALPVELSDRKTGNRIASAYNTALYFLWEEEFDCSKEEPIAYFKPTAKLSVGLKLARNEGQYVNDQNDLVCFDPSVYEKGPACLLVRKDHMQKILQESGLSLVWIIQGEKQIFGNNHVDMPNFDHKISGLYSMDSKGAVKGGIESYIRYY